MAKKDEKDALGGIFDKTEKEPGKALEKDLIKPTSFGLLLSERSELDKIAAENGLKRNAVGRWAIQYFIKQYGEGKISLQRTTVQVEKLKAP
jgi:hypothetical protein